MSRVSSAYFAPTLGAGERVERDYGRDARDRARRDDVGDVVKGGDDDFGAKTTRGDGAFAGTVDVRRARAAVQAASSVRAPAHANFPASRTILWDDTDASADASSSASGSVLNAYAYAPRVKFPGECTRELARMIAEELVSVDNGDDNARGAASSAEVRAIGVNKLLDGVVTVRLAKSDEDEDGDVDVDGGLDHTSEMIMTLIPYDGHASTHEVATNLHGTAWDDAETLRETFYAACASDEPLCPAMFWPMRAVATLVDDGDFKSAKALLRVVVAIEVPTCAFALKPIFAPRLAANPTSLDARALSMCDDNHRVTTGFITLDRTRRVVFLDEAARGTELEPVTGIWVQGVESVNDVAVWAACVRFACSDRLHKLTQRGKYLLAVYLKNKGAVDFYEVDASHASSPFTPYGADFIAFPGEEASARATPVDEGVAPQYFTVTPEVYGAEVYGKEEEGEEEEKDDDEDEDEVEYEYSDEYSDSDDEERAEHIAQMEYLQKEIESLRQAIASASVMSDDEYDDEYDDDNDDYDDGDEEDEKDYSEDELEYEIRRRHDDFDEQEERDDFNQDSEPSVSDSVRQLAEEINDHVRRSKLETQVSATGEFDPKSSNFATAQTTSLRGDGLKLRRPSELAIDDDSALRAALRLEYGDIPHEPYEPSEVAEEYYPKIKFVDSDGPEQAEGDVDDAIIAKYIAKYGADALLGA